MERRTRLQNRKSSLTPEAFHGATAVDPETGRYIWQAGGPGSYSFANNDPTGQYVHAVTIGAVTSWDAWTSREVMTDAVGALQMVGGAVVKPYGDTAIFRVANPTAPAESMSSIDMRRRRP